MEKVGGYRGVGRAADMQPPARIPRLSEFERVRVIVPDGVGTTAQVKVGDVYLDGVIGFKYELRDACSLGVLTLTIEGATLDADALRIMIDGDETTAL